jgi:hypothetical protein
MGNWDKDRQVDYLSWIYPRLSQTLEHYKDTGAPFESYLASVLFWSAREYRATENEHNATEKACWEARGEELFVSDEYAMYLPEDHLNERLPLENKSGRTLKDRELLVLLCKSYWFVSDDFVERIAPLLNMKTADLLAMLDKIKALREVHDENVRSLKMSVQSQYFRCVCFEKRLTSLEESNPNYQKTRDVLIRARARLVRMKKRLSGLRLSPSNRQIAEVLGIPQGTIDSTMYTLKKKFADMYDD